MASDAALLELEAVVAIMGEDDVLQDTKDGSIVLFVAPQCDEKTEAVGAFALEVHLPPGYPEAQSASIVVKPLAEVDEPFRGRAGKYPWLPGAEDTTLLQGIVDNIVRGAEGEPVVYIVVDAVRTWLEENTLRVVEKIAAPDAEMVERMRDVEVSEDDLELDSDDMDQEMIDALREVLRGTGKLVHALDAAEAMKAGSKQQRAALRGVWRALTPAQRKEMVASSDEDDDDDSDEDIGRRGGRGPSDSNRNQVQTARTNQQKQAPCPPPAERSCPRGHVLSAVNSKPADYRKLEGNVGNCDLCDVDFKYTAGGYHCDSCKTWDCCVVCGGRAASEASKSSRNKKQKSKKR